MRSVFYVLSALAVMGLAFWAYNENYKTQQAHRHVEELNAEIAGLKVELGVLRAEWAYLNRPDRLRDLAEINFPRLKLLPFRAEQFGAVDEVAFPGTRLAPIMNTVTVSGRIGGGQ